MTHTLKVCFSCGDSNEDVNLHRYGRDDWACDCCDPDVDPENIYGLDSIRQSIKEDRK